MESNTAGKVSCSCHHSRQTAGFFLNLLVNILIICVGTFYLIQLSKEPQYLKDLKIEVASLKQEVRILKEGNRELEIEVSMLKQIYSGVDYEKDMKSVQLVRREVLSSPSQLVKQFEEKVSALKLDVDHIDAKIRKYHPKEADTSCSSSHRLNPYTGTCFRFVMLKKNWFDAKQYCEADGDYLATFDTVDSTSWYRQQQLVAGWSGPSWIGGRKVGSTWRWYGMLTGPIAISYWGLDEPNDVNKAYCLGTVVTEHYHWDDSGCNNLRYFACERKAF